MKLQTKLLATTVAASLALLNSAHAYTWSGAVSSDPNAAGNWDTVPTYGSTNAGNLLIVNGPTNAANPLTYSSTQGDTTFTGNIRIGAETNAAGSGLTITGGNVLVNSSGTSTIGYHGAGTLNVSGGSLTVNGTDQFWFGNEAGYTTNANISGTGTVNIGDQFLLSRDGGTVNLNITGNGVFNVTNTSGTQYNAANRNPAGVATINLSGSGIFRQTASSNFSLTNNFTVNFASGATGKLSINGFTQGQFETFVSDGTIKIDGFVADASSFTYTSSGGLGSYQLTAVPEPSTWVMMIGGLGMMVAVKRVRVKKA